MSVLLVWSVWAGCVQVPDCPEGCVEVAEGEEVRLGVALSLSGAVGDVGEQGARAVELAVAQRGQLAGFDLAVVVEDSACTGAGGVSAMDVLVARANLVGVVGPSCSVAAAAILEEGPLPRVMVSPSNTSPLLTRPDLQQPGYLRVAPSDAQQGERMAGYAAGTLGLTRAVVVHDGSAYLKAIGAAFVGAFAAEGGEVLGDEVLGDDPEPLIASLLGDPPDLLYMALPAVRAAQVALRLRAEPGLAGLELAGLDILDDPAFLEAAGDAAEGAWLTRFVLDHAGAGYESFVAAWEARYDDTPSALFHAHAWDAAQLLFAGLEEVAEVGARGSLWIDLVSLREALYAVDGLPALTGVLTCDEWGDCAAPTPVDVRVVVDGEAVPAPGP